MALKLNERYPGRFNNPDSNYPQGSFKNRSAPGAKDGSYLEKDWANDKEGFFQWLLKTATIAANGSVDTALSSQYATALDDLYLRKTSAAADSSKLGNQPPSYYATSTSLSGKLDTSNAFAQTQNWGNFTGSRAANVLYTNTTGKPIGVAVYANIGTGASQYMQLQVNGFFTTGYEFAASSGTNTHTVTLTTIVPPGATYKFVTAGLVTLNEWVEIR